MQLSTLAPALRGQQSMQPKTQNDTFTAAPLPSAAKDAFHNTSTQKAPQFGCIGWFRRTNVNARDEQGQTAIVRALINGKTAKVRSLVNKGADVSISDNKGNFPLKLAARENNVTAARELLRGQNFNIDQQDENGYTALMTAALHGNREMADFLLQQGADRNIRTNLRNIGGLLPGGGSTALDIAVSTTSHARYLSENKKHEERSYDIVKLLTPPGERTRLIPVPSSYKGKLVIHNENNERRGEFHF